MGNLNDFGQENNEIRLAFVAGGRTDVTLVPKTMTLGKFAARLSKPKVGAKDGSYYIRGGDLVERRRADENLKSAELIILDGDSRIDPETGEIIAGAPPLEDVTEILDRLGVCYIAHTSHSYRPDERFWKYRVIIPAPVATPQILSDCVEYLIDTLNQAGVWLNDVAENRRWSQPWYLPRVATEADLEAFLFVSNFDASIFDPAIATAWAGRKRAEDAALEAARSKAPAPRVALPEGPSIIEGFNKAHGLSWVRQELENQGYRFSHFSAAKGTYRYIAPGSETGEAGVVVFQGAQGDWCTYSHHGSHDPLSGRLTDPVGMFAAFHHGNDIKSAVRHIGREKAAEELVIPILPTIKPGAGEYTDFDVPLAEPVAPPRPLDGFGNPKIPFLWAKDLPEIDSKYIIDGLLPAAGVSIIYGVPGAYKSFVALYWASMIASGRPVLDNRETDPGDVIYVVGEGESGQRARWTALREAYHLDPALRIGFVPTALNLTKDDTDTVELVHEIRRQCPDRAPKLVIIDTLNTMFGGGDENSAADMGNFLRHCKAIHQNLNLDGEKYTAVLVVHHGGKDADRGARGSSALLAGIDASIEVINDTSAGSFHRRGHIFVHKMKDGPSKFGVDFLVKPYDLPTTKLTNPAAPYSLYVTPISEADKNEARAQAAANNREYRMLIQFLNGDKSCDREAYFPAFNSDYILRKGDEFTDKKEARKAMNSALGRLKGYGLISLTETTITLL